MHTLTYNLRKMISLCSGAFLFFGDQVELRVALGSGNPVCFQFKRGVVVCEESVE